MKNAGMISINGREMFFFEGETVAETASRNGAGIEQPCGGMGVCGKCAIYVKGRPSARLACQTISENGMDVTFSDFGTNGAKILEFGAGRNKAISPEVTSSLLPEAFASSAEGGVFGIALDIGTTTIAASLVDLRTGASIVSASCTNPQIFCGSDVISRISYASDTEEGLEILHAKAIEAVNELIEKLCRDVGISAKRIFHIIAAGNTKMEHCFWGVSPASIGRTPFTPAFYQAERKRAGDLGIAVCPFAFVDMIPNIAGHIGGDAVSGVYATEMLESDEITLLVDIGTNNEMILGNRCFLIACSAAAGPAFEGARIRDGMRAADGAIERVRFEKGRVSCSVVGDGKPMGICGSGLIDAVSGMLDAGVISRSGRMVPPEDIAGNPYAELVVSTSQGREFRIAPSGEGGFVSLTQRDVREVQLARGAIVTGIEMLTEHAGIALERLDRVFLAGAFGNYMDIEKAISLGIIPDIPRERIRLAGNSAGTGCIKALLDADWKGVTEKIARGAKHLELASSEKFQDKFVKNLEF